MSETAAWRRVLVKLSGESLGGGSAAGVDASAAARIADELASAYEVCNQIGVVIGAGNLLRGQKLAERGMDRIRCDHAGMIGTVLNAVVLEAMLNTRGLDAVAFSAFEVGHLVRPMEIGAVRAALDAGRVVVFAGGTGNPLFTTDSAAALRALEIGAQVFLKATTVDGVYSGDPRTDRSATRYAEIRFAEVLQKKLRVMDLTAVSLCMDHGLPIRVFNFDEPGALRRLVGGADEGTLIH
jgi:uridylate kinase